MFPTSSHPILYLTIAGREDTGRLFTKFEWKSMVNGGYIIRAKLQDSDWLMLQGIATEFYLQKGRKEPTEVIFELEHPGIVGPNAKTGKYKAYMTDLDARGINKSGSLEFVAVDPPSFWLNGGASSGKVYTGNVQSVIEQVLEEWFILPNPGGGGRDVSKTTDFEQNKWWMMRQDPKTFIRSLLDWSAKITEKETNWLVSSDGALERGKPTIHVKEQAAKEPVFIGIFAMNTRTPGANDIYNFEFLADTFISCFQKQMITQGISAVSERYFDRIMDESRKIVHVHDDNTSNKWNVNISQDQGFAKPTDIPGAVEKPHEWSTSLWMVPQHNAQDIGKRYDEYIDGRARGQFLDMLSLVMRIKIRCTGIAVRELNNSHNLGVSWLTIKWMQPSPKLEPYFLSGDWMVYGFHHIVTIGHWYTDIYAERIDYDSSVKKIPGSNPNSGRG